MKRFWPSQTIEMIPGLTAAAVELGRAELFLTNDDVVFLKACGIEASAKVLDENEKTLGRQILERFWEEDR
jgi:hypothetical protein